MTVSARLVSERSHLIKPCPNFAYILSGKCSRTDMLCSHWVTAPCSPIHLIPFLLLVLLPLVGEQMTSTWPSAFHLWMIFSIPSSSSFARKSYREKTARTPFAPTTTIQRAQGLHATCLVMNLISDFGFAM